jgi:hypothetical protein
VSEQDRRPPHEAVLRLLDHQLEASEVSALGERLRDDETARREAAQLLLQIGILGEMAREPDGTRLPIRPRPEPQPRRALAAVVVTALAAAAALLLVLNLRRPPAHPRAGQRPPFARAVHRSPARSVAVVAGASRALLVHGGEPDAVPAGDAVMLSHLEGLGFSVTQAVDAALSADDLLGKDLVVVSASTDGKVIRAKLPELGLRDAAVPVVTCESATFDLLGMTAARTWDGAVILSGYGSTPYHTTLEILAPDHPLAAGLTGARTIASAQVALSWGHPSASAIRVAAVGAGNHMAVQFAYERGAPMVGLDAPARRVACFVSAEAGEALTGDGWALFDAGVRWASGQ